MVPIGLFSFSCYGADVEKFSYEQKAKNNGNYFRVKIKWERGWT